MIARSERRDSTLKDIVLLVMMADDAPSAVAVIVAAVVSSLSVTFRPV